MRWLKVAFSEKWNTVPAQPSGSGAGERPSLRPLHGWCDCLSLRWISALRVSLTERLEVCRVQRGAGVLVRARAGY